MAICDDHPGLRAEILVDGQPLQEYDDEEGAPDTISKYVEATSGKEFAVRVIFCQPFTTQHGVQVRLSVDGASDRTLFFPPDKIYSPAGATKRGVSFQEDGKWYRRNYRFTSLNIGETPGTIW